MSGVRAKVMLAEPRRPVNGGGWKHKLEQIVVDQESVVELFGLREGSVLCGAEVKGNGLVIYYKEGDQ